MKSKTLVITLCPRCLASFEDAGDNAIKRANPKQRHKEACSICQSKHGYDYKLSPKSGKEKRR